MCLATFFSTILLTVMFQSAEVDAQPWRSADPDQATPAATAEPSSNPQNLPMILEEKPRPATNETPASETPASEAPASDDWSGAGPTTSPSVTPSVTPSVDPTNNVPSLMPSVDPTNNVPNNVPSVTPSEIARTSHEVVESGTESPAVATDLERMARESIAVPSGDPRISGRPVRLIDVLSASVFLPQPQPHFVQSAPQQRGVLSILGGGGSSGVVTGGSKPVPMVAQVFYKDPREEQKRVLAYWQLAQSLGQYNAARKIADFWGAVVAQPGDEALLETARASAQASLCEACVSLVADQHVLAEVANLAIDAGLPLPSDPPHVGTYLTRYEQLDPGKSSASLGRRLDATLPLCREVIKSRTASSISACSATQRLARDYAAGQATFAKLTFAVDQWQEQQRAFLRATYAYNSTICEYVVSVAGVPADRGTLLTMLIRPSYSVAPQDTFQPIGGLQPVSEQPEPPVVTGQAPTMAPVIDDPAVRPASGELPIRP